MASLGKLNSSGASIVFEPTAALANFNFDFSLVVQKAPEEFLNVGNHLSRRRRQEAENGAAHVVARRLGILFKAVLPPIQELIKAYGTRASEIAGTSATNPTGDSSYGFFAQNVGADATTLWAAATSGKPAIACHLLACMLARIWDPPEATAIWAEIVAERKAEINRLIESEEEIEMELLVASRQTLERSDLANWDASARAWLQVADAVMSRKQIQVRLIFDNLGIPVNSKPDTYTSVIHAWTSSMSQMEQLLRGTPIRVMGGEVALGLTSWHLYPDMVYFPSEAKTIKQNDPLFENAGILTLGLETRLDEHKSIYWSLPLAHLRYYGLPVAKSASMVLSERGRLTLEEFLWALTAAYIRRWDDDSVSTEEVVEFTARMANILHRELFAARNDPGQSTPSWLSLIESLCETYILISKKEYSKSQDFQRLRNLGRTHCKAFDPSLRPFQGIFSVSTFLRVGVSLDVKFALLRDLASQIAGNPRQTESTVSYQFIIRYEHVQPGYLPSVGYITAQKERRLSDETGFDFYPRTDESSPKEHRQWGDRKNSSTFRGLYNSGQYEGYSPFELRGQYSDTVELYSGAFIYDKVYGDAHSLAMFRRRPQSGQRRNEEATLSRKTKAYQDYFSPRMMMDYFGHQKIDAHALALELKRGKVGNEALLAMTLISELFRGMTGATIDVRTIQCNFAEFRWLHNACEINKHQKSGWACLDPRRMDEETLFSCIAMTESGSFDIHPKDLKNVMAVSSLESLFISSALLQDPSHWTRGTEIRRVAGNIGKAGMAFLIPPLEPMIREFGINQWHMIDHGDFTGEMEDRFSGTSLHLSFSKAQVPLLTKFTGSQDCEVYLTEAIVSVYDNSSWMADLDILSALRSPKLIKEYVDSPKQPAGDADVGTDMKVGHDVLTPALTAINSYAEVLTPPPRPGIINADKNWQARLAVASICLQKDYTVILIPQSISFQTFIRTQPGFFSYVSNKRDIFII